MMKYTALYPRVNDASENVRVFLGRPADQVEVGSYSIDRTRFPPLFHPFLGHDGRDYALCKRTRARLAVIALPSCAHVCDDEGVTAIRATEVYTRDLGLCRDVSRSALVAGHTVRDSSVVEHLDLSAVPEGRLVRTARLGLVRLVRGMTLEQAVRPNDFGTESNRLGNLELCVARSVDDEVDLGVHAGLLAEEISAALGGLPAARRGQVCRLLSEMLESIARGDPHDERLELLEELKRAARVEII